MFAEIVSVVTSGQTTSYHVYTRTLTSWTVWTIVLQIFFEQLLQHKNHSPRPDIVWENCENGRSVTRRSIPRRLLPRRPIPREPIPRRPQARRPIARRPIARRPIPRRPKPRSPISRRPTPRRPMPRKPIHRRLIPHYYEKSTKLYTSQF